MKKPSVGMIIEGSYPYIVGGVASWCQSLISNLQSIDFKIIAILPEQYKDKEIQYKMPNNIVDFKKIWLGKFGEDYKRSRIKLNNRKKKQINNEFCQLLDLFFEQALYNNYKFFPDIVKHLFPASNSYIDFRELFSSKRYFALLVKIYKKFFKDLSFMNFFWAIQNILQPLYKLGTHSIPYADCYHIISTGYAGFVGVLAKVIHNSPLILTEHGIYVNERRDEIDDSDKIHPEFKNLWKGFFKHLCSLTYPFCDRIITLYSNNAISQIEENCMPGKIEIIPNGINLDIFSNIAQMKKEKFHVGIVARVVPIKDILTFIKSAKYVCDKISNIHFFIIGPTDEDTDYYKKCKNLLHKLELNDKITFTGKVNMKEYYQKIDVMVLTSVREAQPLTIMEAMAARIPCISTDVGSCSELLEGVGFITPSKSPEKTGEAILKIASNKMLWNSLSIKSQEKAISDYDWDEIVKEYNRIYTRYSKWQA